MDDWVADSTGYGDSCLRENEIIMQQQLAEIEAIYRSAPIGLNVLDRDL
jgi:hypothetical protein